MKSVTITKFNDDYVELVNRLQPKPHSVRFVKSLSQLILEFNSEEDYKANLDIFAAYFEGNK